MYTDFEQWVKSNKNLSTPFNEWSKACTEICKRTTQQNLEMIGENASRFSEQLKRFSNVRKPEDFLNMQKEILTEDVNSSIECIQKYMHNAIENMEELTEVWKSLFGSLQEVAVHNMNKATEKTERADRSK